MKPIRQTIITRYLGPTNFRGSRIKATCERGSVTVSYDHALNIDENNHLAAQELVNKFLKEDDNEYHTPLNENPWGRERAQGVLPNGDQAHVYIG